MKFIPKATLAAAYLLGFTPLTWAAPHRSLFKPSAADRRVTGADDAHYAVVDPSVSRQGQLVLVLPGTGATPSQYTEYCDNAASLGFHVLALMYPNEKSINALCELHAPRDPRAQKWARLEVIDGINRWGFLSVDRVNCIDSRFLKAIQYLASANPGGGWGAFLKRGQIDWEKVVVAGHSQGGGMAGVIAKTRNVKRCVMFTSMDYWEAGNRPCNWMLERPRTPVERWYFLAHERDQILDFAKMQTSAAGLGLDPYGPFVRVESATDPSFGGTHCLSTNRDPASIASKSFHGSVLVNPALARNADGLPALKPAWDYMLLHNNSPVTR